MEWYQVLMIIFSNFGMFLVMQVSISKEMKDFHGRLCTLEERYYQWLMKEKKQKMIIFDWIFSAWMLSTIGVLLIIIFILVSIHRRILKIDEKLFQIALIRFSQPQIVSYKTESNNLPESKKGGWPKGKKRKKSDGHNRSSDISDEMAE